MPTRPVYLYTHTNWIRRHLAARLSLVYIYYIIITIRWKRRRRRRPFPFFSWPYEKGDGGNISIIILLICLYSPSIYTTHAADVALCNNYVFYMQTHLSRENCQPSPSNPSAPTTTTMTVYPWIFVLRLRSLFARHTRIKTIWWVHSLNTVEPFQKRSIDLYRGNGGNRIYSGLCFYCFSPLRSTRSLSHKNTEKHSPTILLNNWGFFFYFYVTLGTPLISGWQ